VKITYDDQKHAYTVDGDPVPSVTQILDAVTDKSAALAWWGMRVGYYGILQLIQQDKLNSMLLSQFDADDHLSGQPTNRPDQGVRRGKKTKTPLEALAIENKLSTNHIRDAKGDLGTLIHSALETVGVTEKLPNLDDYAPDVRPYLQAFAAFWLDQDPMIIEQESIVGSAIHRYAGRFDLVAQIDGQRCLLDYKTSKGIYPSMSEQLRLYEVAYTETVPESDPFDRLAIVHLRPDGKYQIFDCFTSEDTALAAVQLYHAREADRVLMPKEWGR